MEREELDGLELLFRRELADYEAPGMLPSWELIRLRLPVRHRWLSESWRNYTGEGYFRYAAAAAVAMLLIGGGYGVHKYYRSLDKRGNGLVVGHIESGSDTLVVSESLVTELPVTSQSVVLPSSAALVDDMSSLSTAVSAVVSKVSVGSNAALPVSMSESEMLYARLLEPSSLVPDRDYFDSIVDHSSTALSTTHRQHCRSLIDSIVDHPSSVPSTTLRAFLRPPFERSFEHPSSVSSKPFRAFLRILFERSFESFSNVPSKYLTANASSSRSAGRWGFGLGGGSYTPGVSLPSGSDLYADGSLHISPRSLSVGDVEEDIQGMRHSFPLTFGISTTYGLTDHWLLRSGLVYTLLSSEWASVLEYVSESRRRLHFIGLPLGVDYLIGDWGRISFYGGVGMLVEYNVYGDVYTRYYRNGVESLYAGHVVRMSELLYSMNLRLGASYPLYGALGLYIEGGGEYYFANGSVVRTIRTDHPFHVSLQAGLRVGF